MSSARSGGMMLPSICPAGAPLRALSSLIPFLFVPFLLLGCSFVLAPGARADAPVGWRQLNVTGPSGRYAEQMAYDSARDRVVLFGGYASSGFLNDTWEWDGSQWAQVATTGPSPRTAAAMVYDAARGKVLLFGGTDSTSMASGFGDTWTWDGSQWTQVASTGPSPRYNAAVAYDSARQKVVLTGGGSNSPNGLTWEWDGSQWTHPQVQEPSYRGMSAMAYDSTRQKTVLFGGGMGVPLGDTWEWNGSAWTRVATSGPSPRYSAMAYDSARGKCVLFGGMPNASMATFLNDTWEWDGTLWVKVPGTGPNPRGGAAIAYDSKRHQVLLFGGLYKYPPAFYDDTWVYGALPASPFTLDDAVHAMQFSSGLATPSGTDILRYDVEAAGTSGGCVDILDVVRIALKVAGLDANP